MPREARQRHGHSRASEAAPSGHRWRVEEGARQTGETSKRVSVADDGAWTTKEAGLSRVHSPRFRMNTPLDPSPVRPTPSSTPHRSRSRPAHGLGTLVLLGLLGMAACDRPCDEIVDEETCRKRDDCAPRSGLDPCDGQLYYGSCTRRDSWPTDQGFLDEAYLVDGRCLVFKDYAQPHYDAYESCESECYDDWLMEQYPSYFATTNDD